MSSFNLVQIVPSLDSGGVERGTVDVANFLAEKKIQNFIITSGGKMIKELDDNFNDLLFFCVLSRVQSQIWPVKILRCSQLSECHATLVTRLQSLAA